MKFSQNLAEQGIKISFLNTEFNHKRVLDAFGKNVAVNGLLRLVSVPDGLEDGEDRNQLGKFNERLREVMPRQLKEFIHKVNASDDDKISCVLAYLCIGFGVNVAAELEIPTVGFWPASVFQLMLLLSIPKLINDGLIDENVTPLQDKIFQLSPMSPAVHPTNFLWLSIDDTPSTQKNLFDFTRENNKSVETTDLVLGNSSIELEPEGFNMVPKVQPIGPLPAANRLGNLSGNFWPEDPTCLQWLDGQPPGSVIYVAFGSFTVFDEIQFQELALGLELTKRPFLRVVREDCTKGKHHFYPEGFKKRVGNGGKMVSWEPQGAVLRHFSIDCFISHCGWNSSIEGVSNGAPFLCWPYFANQFLNESYICDIWKVGLRFERDERGIIGKEEIKSKVEQLVGDDHLRTRAVELKQRVTKTVGEAGTSGKVFEDLVQWLKS
ncbi:putative UDP-Glycosyltransferase superfamily protein [Hibiscus syriacus]|uniref:UDP-Glycosyltransferase superfamily protein n=2 Tax=Hibiscus syriacus TaxID=106335 RepID=A0A6A2ZQZ3_HIBSY|nr:putative UDP-Glycosyltransferase superfamily protein [Hibiscus syriacus]